MYVYWSVNTHSSECSEVFGPQEGGKILKHADICIFSWLPKKHFQKLKTLIWTWISDWNLSGNSHSGHGSDNRWHLLSVHCILALGTPKFEGLLRRLTILFQKSNQTKNSYRSLVILLTVPPYSELLCICLKWCCKTLTHDMENASAILADKRKLRNRVACGSSQWMFKSTYIQSNTTTLLLLLISKLTRLKVTQNFGSGSFVRI